PDRGLERTDLPAHRHGRSTPDARTRRRPAAHVAGTAAARDRPPAPQRPRARHRLAGIAQLSRLHPLAGPGQPAPRGDAGVVHQRAARRGLRRIRRRPAPAPHALGAGLDLHPRDRAAAAPGRPLYRRTVRGAVRRHTGAAMGARCAPRPAAHHGGLEPACRTLRARGDRPGRDPGAGPARGRAVRRQHRRGRRPRPDARRGHAACAGDRSPCCRPCCPARRRRRARAPATCRPNATTPRLRVDPVSLTRTQLRTLALAALGGALEFYDFVIFVFFATTMGALFFPADMPEWMRLVQTFGIFAAGYLARPLGGIVLAHFGDLRGRKRMFMLSIFMMAVPTLLMGLLPTYASIGVLAPVLLLLLRVMQG